MGVYTTCTEAYRGVCKEAPAGDTGGQRRKRPKFYVENPGDHSVARVHRPLRAIPFYDATPVTT